MFLKRVCTVFVLWFVATSGVTISSICPQKCTCTEKFKNVNCESKRLSKVPDEIPVEVKILKLGFNEINEIKAKDFRNLTNLVQLSLMKNNIVNIDEEAFAELGNLKELNLRKNQLKTLPLRLFRGTGSLRNVYLTENYLINIPDFSGSINLTLIRVDTNKISSANFPKSFENLKKLSTINLANNGLLEKITEQDFQYLNKESVRTLNLGRCNLTQVDDNVFSFKHLQSLSLQYNTKLSLTSLKNIFKALANTNSSELASLTLSGIINSGLDSETFKDLIKVPIKTLNMDHTAVGIISAGTFDYFPKLEYLYLRNSDISSIQSETFTNKLTSLQRLSLSGNSLSTFPQITISSLKELDLSDNNKIRELRPRILMYLSHLEKLILRNCGIDKIYSDSLNGLGSLTYLDLSKNNFGGTSPPGQFFQPVPNLAKLNLSNNKMNTMASSYKLFSGLENLEELDLSNNDCWNVSNKIFQPLKNLVNLTLDKNELRRAFASDSEGQLFRGLTNLQKISVAENKLTFLHQNLLKDQKNLTSINLRENELTAWPKNFLSVSDGTNKTVLIDLSQNNIPFVTEAELSTLPSNVNLNLSSNPFDCGCDLIWFRRWISAHNDSSKRLIDLRKSYNCNSPETLAGKSIESFDADSVERSCHPPPWKWISIAVGSAGAVASMVICTLIYRYRWHVRYRLYKLKRRWNTRQVDGYDRIEDDPQYEIMLSYKESARVKRFVKNVLLPEIDISHISEQNSSENEAEDSSDEEEEDRPEAEHDKLQQQPDNNKQKWKTFVYERDILGNESALGKIAEAICSSKRIILILTKHYVKDARSRFEMDLAVQACIDNHVGLSAIIVIQLDRGVTMKLPKSLHSLASEPGRILQFYEMKDDRPKFLQLLREQITRPLENDTMA